MAAPTVPLRGRQLERQMDSPWGQHWERQLDQRSELQKVPQSDWRTEQPWEMARAQQSVPR